MTSNQISGILKGMAILILLSTQVGHASEEVLALERQEMASSCSELEFLDGYIEPVDANGDELKDYLVNTQHLLCDGSQMMWCGTLGCVHRIWVQRPGGGFDKVLDTYAFKIAFDRPGDTSFLVTTRNGSERQSLGSRPDHGNAILAKVQEEVFTDRWSFRNGNSPVAGIGGEDSALYLGCENGAVRISYTAHWMSGSSETDNFINEWNGSGIVATFEAAGVEIDTPMEFSKASTSFASKDTVEFGSPLINALSKGNWVTIHHGGSIEHELRFGLRGSSGALRSLYASCR